MHRRLSAVYRSQTSPIITIYVGSSLSEHDWLRRVFCSRVNEVHCFLRKVLSNFLAQFDFWPFSFLVCESQKPQQDRKVHLSYKTHNNSLGKGKYNTAHTHTQHNTSSHIYNHLNLSWIDHEEEELLWGKGAKITADELASSTRCERVLNYCRH